MLVEHLPADAASRARLSDVPEGWDLKALLLADVFHALTGEAHPSRPQPKKASRYAEKRRALEEQRRRVEARKRAHTTT